MSNKNKTRLQLSERYDWLKSYDALGIKSARQEKLEAKMKKAKSK